MLHKSPTFVISPLRPSKEGPPCLFCRQRLHWYYADWTRIEVQRLLPKFGYDCWLGETEPGLPIVLHCVNVMCSSSRTYSGLFHLFSIERG